MAYFTLPQCLQAIAIVEDVTYSIVSYLDTNYHQSISEIMISTPIDIHDSIRISGKKPNHMIKHLGDQFEDIDVYYKDEASTPLIEKVIQDEAFKEILIKMGHHSFYIQEGQLFIHINPSHDIHQDFFIMKQDLLKKAKQCIEGYIK